MPNPALEPAVPSGIEAATLQGDDRVGHKNPEDSSVAALFVLEVVENWSECDSRAGVGKG
jgi:hypothetical protein